MRQRESQIDYRFDAVREEGQPDRSIAPSGIRTAVSALIFATVLEAGCHVRYWFYDPNVSQKITGFNQAHDKKREDDLKRRLEQSEKLEKEALKHLKFASSLIELARLRFVVKKEVNSINLNESNLKDLLKKLYIIKKSILENGIVESEHDKTEKDKVLINTDELIQKVKKALSTLETSKPR